MEKKELKRGEAIKLFNGSKRYVEAVGKNADKLAWMCNNIITYEPNEQFMEENDKEAKKLFKKYERAISKVSNNYAKVYEEGDKKGTHVLDEKGNLIFTAENKNKLNEEIERINDEYEEESSAFMKEKVSIYIEKASSVPEVLAVEFKNALELIIP